MKILLKQFPVRQFGSTPVICSDLKMSHLIYESSRLNNGSFMSQPQTLDAIKRYRENGSSEFWCSRSGAKLCINLTDGRNFYVYGYHYNGQDMLDLIAELNMLESLYHARRFYKESLPLWDRQKRNLNFSITY